MDKRNKKNKKIILFVVLFLLVIINIFIIYKNIYLYKHSAAYCEDYEEVIKGYKNYDKMSIEKKNCDYYLELDEFMIRNDFYDYKKEDNISDSLYEADRYIKDVDGVKSAVYFSVSEEIIDMFTSGDVSFFSEDNINTDYFKKTDRVSFLKKNNINDDLDYIMFIRDNYYLKRTFLDSCEDIRDAYAFNLFTGIMIPRITSFTVIDGDFHGYILNGNNFREVHLLDNKKSYTILFMGNLLVEDEYIKDIVSTVKFK